MRQLIRTPGRRCVGNLHRAQCPANLDTQPLFNFDSLTLVPLEASSADPGRSVNRLVGGPYRVRHLRRERRFVLRHEAPVVRRDRLRRVLDRIARLLAGTGLFEHMGRQDIAPPWRQPSP